MENDSLLAAPVAHTLPQPAPFSRLRARHNGWTPERQRCFIEVLAACGMVREAAAAVGMSAMSAYNLRNRAEGRNFALAWDAALIRAREVLLDVSIERAFNGTVTKTIIEGKVVKEHVRHDNHLLLATLTRLDMSIVRNAGAHAVAKELDEFLDCLEQDAAEAADFETEAIIVGQPNQPPNSSNRDDRSSRFLESRGQGTSLADQAACQHAALMRRLSHYGSTGAGYGDQIPVDDLDPEAAEGWTRDQWHRALQSGLVTLSPDAKKNEV